MNGLSHTLIVNLFASFFAFCAPKEDLGLKNHLVGLRQLYLKLSFLNVQVSLRIHYTCLEARSSPPLLCSLCY